MTRIAGSGECEIKINCLLASDTTSTSVYVKPLGSSVSIPPTPTKHGNFPNCTQSSLISFPGPVISLEKKKNRADFLCLGPPTQSSRLRGGGVGEAAAIS